MTALSRLLLASLLGLACGKLTSTLVEAQNARLITGSDSVTNLPSGITTDGANALRVIGK